MSDFTATIDVPQTPEKVFAAALDQRAWWSAAIEGPTDHVGTEFRHEVPDMHWCTFRIAALDRPRHLSWLALDSWLTFTDPKGEWNGTTVRFDIAQRDGLTEPTFTHEGLTPEFDCYDLCSNAWTGYVTGSLRYLITTGVGQPNPQLLNS